MRSFFLFLGILNFSSLTLAAPSAFVSKCGALAIQNNTTSTLLRDHENCKTVWVLPPTFGLVNISGYMANGNLGLCQEVKDVQKLSHSLTERMNFISQEIMDLSVSYRERQKEVIETKKHVFNLENLPEIREIIDAEEKLSVMEKAIERLYSQLATCAADCPSLKEELRLKKEEKQELKGRLSTLKDHYFELARDHRLAKSKLESAEYALHNIYADIDSRNNKLTALKTTLQQWLLFYSKLEGGTAHLNYDTRWTQNITTLNERYKGQFDFKQVPTRNVRITANFVGSNDKESYLSSMPALLDYVIAGVKFTPWGENSPVEQSSLPSRLAGSVRLSLMGGCPLYYKNFLEADTLVKDDFKHKQLAFSINATYEYPAAFKFNVTARYNLYKMYEKIATASSEGGFFSRESYNNVVEDMDDNDQFSIEWNDEDEMYSRAEKDEIAKTLKGELIGRVLSSMATPVFSGDHHVEAIVPTRTASGAMVVAEGINQTCGFFNIYCQGAVWFIRGLDAIFGNDSAQSKFRQTHNRSAEERWSRTEAKWRSAATGFVNE